MAEVCRELAVMAERLSQWTSGEKELQAEGTGHSASQEDSGIDSQ